MKINFFSFSRRPKVERRPLEMPHSYPRGLTRSFVETGDERCPMAGIWSCTGPTDAAAADDDTELATPATWMLLQWRAFHCHLTWRRYSIAWHFLLPQ
jgi:hypothetical protein